MNASNASQSNKVNSLAGTFESSYSLYTITKIKIIRHRVIGDGCIWEVISITHESCGVSQSVFYHVLNAGQ